MRRLYFILCFSILALAGFAQNKALMLVGYPNYQLTYLSSNGKWACGALNGNGGLTGFLWNLETNEFTMLSDGDEPSAAFAVSDNGVVAGLFYDKEATENHVPVTTAGYWKDGKWHHLETIDGAYVASPDHGGMGLCISHNGEYIGGAMYDKDGVYTPMVWKGGKIFRNLGNGMFGAVNSVSNDGKIAGGWSYTAGSGFTRISTLWVDGKEPQYFCDDEDGHPQRTAKQFSSNEKYMLVDTSILDMETGEMTEISPLTDVHFNFDVYDINNSRTVIGFESRSMGAEQYGLVSRDGVTVELEEYLTELGADFESLGLILKRDGTNLHNIVTGLGISDDEKTYAMMFVDTTYTLRPLIVKVDQNMETREPVAVLAEQLDGLKVAKITWKEPLANAEAVTGYNVYRDGVKVNTELVSDMAYFDRDLENASYSYEVTAVYGTEESVKSTAASVTIADRKLSAPTGLYARQKGLNNAGLQWIAPSTNLINKRYYSDAKNVVGFGGGNNSFEAAIRFSKDEMANYKGCTITQVSFYPLSEQEKWTVKIYFDDELVYTEDVTTPLVYGEKNTIQLKEPVAVPEGKDVYMAVEVTVAPTTQGYNILGIVYGENRPLYSDLVHLSVEEDFYSLFIESHDHGYDFSISWAMSMILAPEGVSADVDNIKNYNIYAGGVKVGETTETSYLHKNLEDGTYNYEVEAVYAGGEISDRTTASVDIKQNNKVYKSVSQVKVTNNQALMTATWQAPLDDDETDLTYATGSLQGGMTGTESNNYGYMAKVIFNNEKLKGYDGYVVNALRFYPMADADFTFIVYENGVQILEQYVEDYELNQWNTVTVEEPFVLNENATYDLVLDCFDVTPEAAALGIDSHVPYVGISDLFSVDGVTFSSFYQQTSSAGNWMLGMVASDENAEPLAVEGYNVRIDNEKKNDAIITETEFQYDFGQMDEETHKINVDVVYTAAGEVKGGAVFFILEKGGIGENGIAQVKVYPNPATNYVKIEGGVVEAVSVYDVNGRLVAQTSDNTVDVSAWGEGMYILKVVMDGEEKTFKLNVVR